jgi:aryl-alcohol dehydrogenase-like predicted oxidoreductase
VSAVGWSAGALAGAPGPATPAALVRAALDAQIDLFDAPPDSDARDALARALGGERRAVTLGTRCAGTEGQAAFSPPGREWRPEEVRRRLEAALRRLQTDWLDLWILDRPPPEAVADDNLWAQLADDRQAGWVRAVGMALDTEDDARAALGRGALDVLALRLHLGQVDPGQSLSAEAAERQVAVVADDPLGSDGTATRLVRGLTAPDTERSEAQAELAGVLSLAGITTVLSPAATPSEIEAHARAATMPLSDVEARELAARLDEARESQREP